ncbi:MAG: hypothetical protein IJP86_08200 [Synergistaceae bacterium]|nr:hypothetical protein [Synergistaceae bacterium]
MASIKNVKQKSLVNFLEWAAAWEIVIFSGNQGAVKLLSGGPKGILTLLTCLLLWGIKSNKRFNIFSFGLMCLMSMWLVMGTLMGSYTFTSLVGPPGTVLCVYLLLSVSDFRIFRERLLKALSQLSAATLITYVIYITTGIGRGERQGRVAVQVFYLFRDWGGRVASIYQEPGQYQIIIFFILVLFVDEFVKINPTNMRYYVRKFGVIIVALLASQSSMGYICLALLLALVFTFNKSVKHNIIVYALIFLAGIATVFFIWQSDTIQQKIDPRNMLTRTSSLAERVADSFMLLRMSFISPWTGLGLRSYDYYHYGSVYGGFPHGDGVNGWLNVAVCLGWPFFFLLIGSMIRGLGRMKQGIPPLLVFAVLLLSQADETYALYYTTFLYVFPFNSYDTQEKLS